MTHVTETRPNLGRGLPGAYAAVARIDAEARQAALDAGLSERLVELLRIRASQINGCAFCLRLHTGDAVAAGEDPDRLAVLPAWRETDYFTATERAALALLESVTLISGGIPADVLAQTRQHLTADQVTAIGWIAIAINAYNRIAITSGYSVAPRAGATDPADAGSSN